MDWFERLKSLPDADRERALRAMPEAERELEALVRELFEGDQHLHEGLERPAAAHVGLVDETIPACIGPFRILARLASGGMGVVYKAQRDFPGRVVALKRVAADLERPASRQRFEHEVQILARLAHPSIARIYEAGIAEGPTGPIPYLVMELIEGKPLTKGAEALGLGVEARLELLARICDAVEYAHQKDVIHCDLKPDNVLLDVHGNPHVLDFGIARVVRGGTPDTLGPQRHGGTPGFMSPEQLAGGDPVPSWDVYALGVLAYELFGIDFDPGAPARVETPARGTRFAEDLAWILLKATHPDGNQRWNAAAALGAALRRCRASQPIPEARPGLARRARLFALRNRTLVALLALVQLAILGGALGTYRQGRRAVHAAESARRQAAKKQEAFDFLRALIELARPEGNRGREYTLRELLDRADGFLPEVVRDAEVRAILQGFLGNAYASLGELEQAERDLRAAHGALCDELGDAAPESLQAGMDLGGFQANLGRHAEAEELLTSILAHARNGSSELDPLRLRAEHELGCALVLSARWEQAGELLEGALAGRKQVLGEEHEETLETLGVLGVLWTDERRFEEAERALLQVLDGQRRVLGPDHPRTLTTLNNLATLYADLERHPEALALLRQELSETERILGPEHASTLVSRLNVALTRAYAGEKDEGLTDLGAILADCERLLEPDHPVNFQAHHALADVLIQVGDRPGAELEIRAALEGRRRIFGETHPLTLRSLDTLTYLLAESRRHEEVVRELSAVRAALRAKPAAEVETALLAKLLDDLGSSLLSLGRHEEALPILREASAIGDPDQAARNARLIEAAERRAAASR
jgi:serine/threonine protein kinase